MKRHSEMQIVYVIIVAAMLGDPDAVRATHFLGDVMTKRQSWATIEFIDRVIKRGEVR